MLKFKNKIAVSLALSAALLTAAAVATPGGSTPILNGHGQWATPIGTIGFEVSAIEMPDGSVQGEGFSTKFDETGAHWFHFEVDEYAYVGEGVIVLGTIDQVFETPPEWLGSKVALAVRDDGSGGSSQDSAISASGLPAWITLDFLLSLPPGLPPVETWFPLQSGSFTIH